jgi:PAS domain S-box-containing protein
MRALFAPAIALMNRLSYPHKFTLISLLFLSLLTLVMVFLYLEIRRDIDFAQRELTGTAYLRPLRSLLQHAETDRMLVQRYVGGETQLAEAIAATGRQIEAALRQVDTIDAELGNALETFDHLAAVKASWQTLQTRNLRLHPGGALHEKFVEDIRALIAQIGDTSNLITDPEIDSYYLMEVVLEKVPDGVDTLTQAIMLGHRVAVRRTLNDVEQSQLAGLSQLLKHNSEQLGNGLEVAFRRSNDKSLRPSLEPITQQAIRANETFAATLNRDFVNARAQQQQRMGSLWQTLRPELQAADATIQIAPDAFVALGTAAVAADLALWDRAVASLDKLLQARIDRGRNRMTLTTICTFLILLLVLYFWVAFYQSVRETVAALDQAAKRMVSGDMIGGVALQNRDELGQVVTSFNSVAARLWTEWTQARTAEALVRESEARTQLIIDTALDAVITTDAQGTITRWNPQAEQIFGWLAEDATGRRLDDLVIPPEYRIAHRHAIQSVLATGDRSFLSTHTEMALLDHAGREFPAEVAISPMETGDTYTFSYFVRDITERKHAEDELQRAKEDAEVANQAKSAFLANMSHELRTPLNAIIGYSEMLQEEAQDLGEDDFIPDLEKIQAAGKHLLALINNILDLSKVEAGKMELYLETFDVPTVVQDVVSTVQPLVQKNGNTLAVRCAEDVGTMRADVTKLRQALFNLLSNAAKFTEQGTIRLEVEREAGANGTCLVFRVADTGIGMAPEQLGRLFQAFAQADASTTRKYGGTGLGLVITRRFCQMMGGDVSVESEPGVGTTFTIRVPEQVVDDRLPTVAGEPGPGVAALPATGNRVLVIDDDPAVHDLLKRYLTKEGFGVAGAAAGAEGVQMARELQPDVIVLDVMMPSMDGWAVLTALKADTEVSDIPVIMLSIVDDKNLGFALGASDYLTKPIDRDRLVGVLEKYRRDQSSGTVLVVEDDPATRQMLRRVLERERWTVAVAENGRVGLERVAEERPALILLDLMMPEMDGFEFVAELHKRTEWRAIPIIVVTAKDLTTEDRLRLRGYVEKILQKGAYSRTELLAEIRDLVATCVRQRTLVKA